MRRARRKTVRRVSKEVRLRNPRRRGGRATKEQRGGSTDWIAAPQVRKVIGKKKRKPVPRSEKTMTSAKKGGKRTKRKWEEVVMTIVRSDAKDIGGLERRKTGS